MGQMKQLPLRTELFWDIDTNNLDVNTHKKMIIERVLSYGNMDELKFILKQYDTNTIKEEIKKIGYLDPKTYQFILIFFNLKEDQLKCYTRRQSAKQHWN